MYRLLFFQIILVSFLFSGGVLSCARLEGNLPRPETLPKNSPANASYLIENNWIQLENGRSERQAAPGSFSKIEVALLENNIYGDLNKDGDNDAVIFLAYQGGGSGTFFYLSTALFENETYRGTNGVLLGDRIGSPFATVKNGLIIVEYFDRRRDEPMTTAPSIPQTRYFILENSRLREIIPAADEIVYQGWLTIGHEVRSFQSCDKKDQLWIVGNSPALSEIIASYRETMAGFPPYAPVFTILAGKKGKSPAEGFGAEYKEGFFASHLVHFWPKGNCKSDLIMLDSPLPGANISSPLTVKGQARGPWFFEGDFPVVLLDKNGTKITENYATAIGEWMTEDFVEFEGTLEFKTSLSGQKGTLVLKKDNPTDLAEFDDFLEIPINFD